MSYKIEGTVIHISDIENKTETFSTRTLVIETSGVYPQKVKFDFVQDRCALLNIFDVGDQVRVFFDIRGREWNGKYFTNLNGWSIEVITDTVSSEPDQPVKQQTPLSTPVTDEGDLPF